MALQITPTDIEDVLLCKIDIFEDDRGSFREVHHAEKYASQKLSDSFVQDNLSISRKGVVRGLHYQLKNPQAKLLTVLKGSIFDVAVDIRKGSPTFGKWVGYELTEQNGLQLYVPEGFAHGFCVLSEEAYVLYKCNGLYTPGDEFGVLWNDAELGIDWPVREGILSEKDSVLPNLSDISQEHLPKF